MATYQGKNVKLDTPRRIRQGEPGYGRKKSVVFVSAGQGKVKRVMFGDPNMSIKKDQPARKRSYCARSAGQGNTTNIFSPNHWSRRAWSC